MGGDDDEDDDADDDEEEEEEQGEPVGIGFTVACCGALLALLWPDRSKGASLMALISLAGIQLSAMDSFQSSSSQSNTIGPSTIDWTASP